MFDKNTIINEFKDFLFEENNLFGGIQLIFKFPNNYGASLVNHCGSYGNELGVLYFEDKVSHLCCSTPITDDVIGHIGTDKEIIDYLNQIKDLEDATL